MMKKLFILSLVLVLLTIIPVFAQEPSYTFQQHTNNTLRVYCNNDTIGFCDSSVDCNINIQKPSSQNIVNNGSMGLIGGGEFSFNLTESNLDEIGIYSAFGSCKIGDDSNAFDFTFKVTPSGLQDNPNFFWLILIFSLGIMIFGFHLTDAWIVLLGTMGLFVVGLYILFFGIAGVKDTFTTLSLGIMILGIAMYVSLRTGMEIIQN